MAILDKFQPLVAARQQLIDSGIDSIHVVMERVLSPTEAVIDGKQMILAGTNNYLGLTFDPDCIAAAREAVTREGTGTTGSRVANGTYAGHIKLEGALTAFFGCKSAIVFSTGYVANLGMIAALTGPGDVLLIDGDCHASIYDGCRLSGAQVIRFRHNDAADLEKRLRRLGEKASSTLIIIEGIYSMLGDRAPLTEIAAVKDKYGAYLLVDEAHSLGVLGAHGRGLAEEVGVEDQVDFIVGTFSKSLGAIGGYCVSNHDLLDLMRYASRPYVFTASPSPSIVASTLTALDIIRSRPQLRHKLWDNAHRLYGRLKEAGYVLGPEPSPVIAVKQPDIAEAIKLWKGLQEKGVYVNLVPPPGAPDGGCLLRCSVSAGHSSEQIERIGDAFASLRKIDLTE